MLEFCDQWAGRKMKLSYKGQSDGLVAVCEGPQNLADWAKEYEFVALFEIVAGANGAQMGDIIEFTNRAFEGLEAIEVLDL